MIVFHLITGLGIGGAENMLYKILPNLPGKHIVCSLTNDDAIGRKLEEKNIEVHYLGLNYFNLPIVMLRLRKLIHTIRPDIINSYLIHANLLSRFFKGKAKLICSVRNKHIDKPLLMLIDRLTKNKVDLYTPNSQAIVPFLVKNGISKKKILVIENGIEFSKPKNSKTIVRKELNIKGNIILCVAKLTKQKGHIDLLKAMAKINTKATLVLAGDGPLRNFLEKNSTKNVQFLGRRNDISELLQAADIFVLPSHYEGMSNALLEAMNAKIPIITTNIAENSLLITHQKEGLLVPINSPKRLAHAIDKLLTEKKLAHKYATAANKAVKKYDINNTVQAYKLLYNSFKGQT